VVRAVVVTVLIAALGLALAAVLRGPRVKTVTVTLTRAGEPDALAPTTSTGARLSRKAVACGTERAAVKHLTDGFVLPLIAKTMTPADLVAMTAPGVTPDSPRLPEEKQVVELENVHVIAAKQEADSDLHVIISTSTGAELNVEAPMAPCESGSPYGAQLDEARAAMDAAMPAVSSNHYTPENLTADIVGVLFFDVLHGQRGAPNGVELHPVTYFSVVSS
jgi:hypothetical protein